MLNHYIDGFIQYPAVERGLAENTLILTTGFKAVTGFYIARE